ncbi:MAG: hypothetical protein QOJ84_73 [Bradyrhizobium sp.]|jgi:hypothetical protein|nr:hypothetical protein [Bradyrhizobium sp.]
MTGHRPFNELTKDFSPERKARVAARVVQLKADITARFPEGSVNITNFGELGAGSEQPGDSSWACIPRNWNQRTGNS